MKCLRVPDRRWQARAIAFFRNVSVDTVSVATLLPTIALIAEVRTLASAKSCDVPISDSGSFITQTRKQKTARTHTKRINDLFRFVIFFVSFEGARK